MLLTGSLRFGRGDLPYCLACKNNKEVAMLKFWKNKQERELAEKKRSDLMGFGFFEANMGREHADKIPFKYRQNFIDGWDRAAQARWVAFSDPRLPDVIMQPVPHHHSMFTRSIATVRPAM